MPPPRRGSSSLRRSRPTATRRIIRVHTEGTRTEPEYLARLLDLFDRPVMLQIDQRHGVPTTLVANAIETRKHNLREARRGRDELIDEHWCVFDHDDHPHLEASITAANVNGIEIASSNPCFELWLLCTTSTSGVTSTATRCKPSRSNTCPTCARPERNHGSSGRGPERSVPDCKESGPHTR